MDVKPSGLTACVPLRPSVDFVAWYATQGSMSDYLVGNNTKVEQNIFCVFKMFLNI